MRKILLTVGALVLGATMIACGVQSPEESASPVKAPAGSSSAKSTKKAPKVILVAKRGPQDVLGDYRYKITLTNNTGEGLDVDVFNFTGKDADGNKYDAMPGGSSGALNPVRLANGKSVTGTINFDVNNIVKIYFEELAGVDKGSAKVKK